ncbi:efflux RND transporter periplasmic adaptor subunit [Undibacterium squillarum]|uniref:efflux RND transporter periplasmic adaptor subunit n=1 Tax=Undibacterium squillarum TaxID=1131567 RepID=UPI0035B37EA1
METSPTTQKKFRWWFLLAPVVLVGGLIWFNSSHPRQEVYTVQRHDFIQTVVASGRVETPHRIDLGSQITAQVLQVPVMEGQQVSKGQLLIVLDARESEALLAQAELQIAQAEAKLRQLREVDAPVAEQSLRQAMVTRDTVRSQHQRQQDLFKRGFIGQAALDESQKNLEVAEAALQVAVRHAAGTAPKGSDTALALATLETARASAAAAKARVSYTRISAPADGVLIARQVEPGDLVQAGKILMTLSPQATPQLVVQIDEKSMRHLQTGQAAVASLDAFPEQRFPAKLVYINPAVNAQTGAVTVKLDVLKVPAEMRQDMTASVDIQVASHPQALLIDSAAIREPYSREPWVMLVSNGKAEKRVIRTGASAGGQTEVLQGLVQGDQVLSAQSAVKAGERVRVAAP